MSKKARRILTLIFIPLLWFFGLSLAMPPRSFDSIEFYLGLGCLMTAAILTVLLAFRK